MVPYLNREAEQVHDDTAGTGWELFGRKAIRQGDWKALWLPRPWGTGEWQLYDLSGDPGEIVDLAGTHPEKLTELLRLWDRYVAENGVITDPVTVFEIDPSLFT